MTPGKFLRLVWPTKGHYCIAHPFKPAGSSVTTYVHKVFATISDAASHVYAMEHSADVFFAILSLADPDHRDPNKIDYKTGEPGARAVRMAENMLAAKCLFFDLDVGADAAKYPSQIDALNGLRDFCKTALLPMPMMVSSGGGVHVYWVFDAEIPALEWRDLAHNLRQLAEALGLKVDPTRTTDSTSVLRVPETFNWKDRANPRRVVVLQEGAVTPVPVLRQLILDALTRAGVTATPAPARGARPAATASDIHGIGSNMNFNDFGPPPTLEEVGSSCAQVRELVASQVDPAHPHYGPLDNTAWYRGLIGLVRHVEDGENWCRKLTDYHPRSVSDIEAKLVQAEKFPPAKCTTFQQFMPWKDAPCQTCKFRNDPSVPNPLAATRKSVAAPPPVVGPGTSAGSITSPPPLSSGSVVIQLVAPGAALQAAMIPNPPKPYERLKTGGISLTRTDKDGNESVSILYAHDLYPIKRLANGESKTEQQLWRVTLPRSGARDFTIDADVLYDPRKFCSALAHNGIYPNKADIPALQDYMVAYISELQRLADVDTQASHLGWADEYKRFVLPSKTLLDDGTVAVTALALGAERATQHITKKGDLHEQIKLMHFFNHQAYVPNQSVVLDAFASIIFHATGHHGIVVNLSGDAGASKSTTLYTAASVWGDPQLWPINGTNRGATANARAQRIVTNANLPTCVDEITHLPVKDAIDLVMNITQPGHRLRLQTDGTERQTADNYKSAIMIATANSSLHSLLSMDNAAGTAGSMRVFEMKFAIQSVHTKAEADEYLRQINQHYGHLGEVFAAFVIRNLAAVNARVQQVVREIDSAAHIQSGERFWSARIAAGIVAGEICRALGLLPYDVAAIREWSITRQIPFMRGVVKDEYRDPLAVLTDYIAEKHSNIVMVNRAGSTGVNVGATGAAGAVYAENTPHGELLGHYDKYSGVLYLLKQGFKAHCNRAGVSSARILEDLGSPRATSSGQVQRIVIDRQIRRTLGAGTNLAKGQSWCFAVDMNHPEISGQVPAQLVPGGAVTPTAPVGNLRSVP